MKRLTLCAFASIAAIPAAAQTASPTKVDAARSHVEEFMQNVDTDRNRLISAAELQSSTEQIFASMDVDADERLTAAEFIDWEFGLSEMARFRGRAQAYTAVVGMVFDMFDRDNDGAVTRTEYGNAMEKSSAYADSDGDGAMTFDEFRGGFLMVAALRRAMVDLPGG